MEKPKTCDLCQCKNVKHKISRYEFDEIAKGLVVIERDGDIWLCENCYKNVYKKLQNFTRESR